MKRRPLLAITVAVISALVTPSPVRAIIADGLKCYRVEDPLLLQGTVELTAADLGLSETCSVKKTKTYCVPVGSDIVDATDNGAPISPLAVSGPNPGDRICYKIRCPGEAPTLPQVSDAFGTRVLQGVRATTLCVPAVDGPVEEPANSGGACSAEALDNAEYILECTEGDVSGTVAPISGSPELHVISIYTTDAADNTLAANVTVERTAPLVLVLSAYDPTHWNVTAAPGSHLERVIVSGFNGQTVTAPDGVPVEIRAPYPNNLGSEGDEGFGEYPSPDALAVILDAEEATGLCLTSFHACYEATQFKIPIANE